MRVALMDDHRFIGSNLTFAQRFVLTVVIALVILFALALFGYLTSRWDEAEAQHVQMPDISPYERQLIELERAAIGDAYKDQIHHLFLTWAKDDSDQPRRAVTGAKQARSMYERSMRALEEREHRLNAR
jgi:hypothetical protein